MNRAAWSLSGALLAGGESRRMGRDKATLDFGGSPLWLRQMNVLREAGASPAALVRRRGQPLLRTRGYNLCDTVNGAGPLAGLHAALVAGSARWVAVLAVDMPQVDAAWFRWLHGFCRPGTGAVARTPDGFEPLAAIYPREALAIATSHLHNGDGSLQHLVGDLVCARQLVAVGLPANECRRVTNCNSPAAWMQSQ